MRVNSISILVPIVVLTVITVIGSLCIVPAYAQLRFRDSIPSPIPHSPPILPEYENYCNEYLRLRISYPDDWSVDENVDDNFDDVRFSPYGNDSLSVNTTLFTFPNRAPDPQSSGDNIGWGQIDPDYIHVLSNGNSIIGEDDLPAYQITYNLSYPDSDPMKATEIFAVAKGRVDVEFHFHVQMNPKDYASYLPSIDHMLQSFKVINDQYSLDDCEKENEQIYQ